MRPLLLLLTVITASFLHAQNITGKIIDDKLHPARSATVLLLKQSDSSLVKSSLSDNDGNFKFTQVADGKYFVAVSVVSHRRNFIKVEMLGKDVLVQTINLSADEKTLQGVTVTATKPFLEQRADKLIVNIEGSATAAGSTALEVLQKVPGILVINEKLTMVGKGTPAIYVDGRLSQYTDIIQILRDISAANIEKIEVISNPGAKYDASGGAVINIILKRNADLGTNVSAYFITGMGLYNKESIHTDRNFYRINPGFNMNHRKGKLNIYGGYGFFHRNQFAYNEFDRIIPPNRFFQENNRPNDVSSHNFRLGADLYADKKNTFGIIARGFVRDGLSEAKNTTYQLDASSGQTLSTFQTFNNTRSKRNNFSANLNWKHSFDTSGTDLNVDIDYSDFLLTNNSEIINVLTGSSYTNNQLVKNPVQFTVVKADYSKPFNRKIRLEAGAKSSFAIINNYLVFIQKGVLDKTRSTDFKYTENINALYSSLTYSTEKWELQGGLRAEQTVAKGTSRSQEVLNRNYWQLFPSVFLTKKINSKLSTVLQYSRRVNRPSYQQQNPFIEYLDSLTYTRGNPFIKPETADGYKLALTYESQPFFSVSYNKKRDVIVDDAPKQEGNLTYTTPENLASFENIVFELNFPIEFGKKISGYGGNQAIYNHYKADYLGATFDRGKWNWLAYWQVAYKPDDTWTFEVSGFYMTKFLEEFIIINDISAVNFGITKTFWDKKGRINLNISDIFYGQKTRGALVYQEINVRFYQLEETRNIRLAFRYSFGNQKLKAARNRTTASDAEENRVKTN
ncbi:MAG: TonB-dependent receptor domain-containing protein [Chitinophagales bacterium]